VHCTVCSEETAEHTVRQPRALTSGEAENVSARQRFTVPIQGTSVARPVGRLHLLTLVPFELRLIAQIAASDDIASSTRSQHFSFVERQTGRRTGSRRSQPERTSCRGTRPSPKNRTIQSVSKIESWNALEDQRSPLWGFASGLEGECQGSAGEHQGISLRCHSPWAERWGNSQVYTNRGGMNRSATLCLCTVIVREHCNHLMASIGS